MNRSESKYCLSSLSDDARSFLLVLRDAMGEVGVLIELRSSSSLLGVAIPDCILHSTMFWIRADDVSVETVDELVALGLVERQSFDLRGMPEYRGRRPDDSFFGGCFIRLTRRDGYVVANSFIEWSDPASRYYEILRELNESASSSLPYPFSSSIFNDLSCLGLVYISSPSSCSNNVVASLTESGQRFARELFSEKLAG